MVLAQLSLLPSLPCIVRGNSLYKYWFQNSKEDAGRRCSSFNSSCFPLKLTHHQVKFVCESLGMRFTEELNSHNCSFVICAPPSGGDSCAPIQVTGDKIVQVGYRCAPPLLHITRASHQATKRRIPCVRLQYLEACCIFGEQLSLDAFRLLDV
jgi:hypothetical protein